jgi:Tol biopolymer transport system component
MTAVVVVLLVLALALAVFVASRPRYPPPFGPAGNGRIAFASDGDIWVADSTESTPRILISGPESDNIPTFSPLGDRVAFLRHPDPTGTVGPFHLMVAATDGTQIRQLSEPMVGLNGIAWAPDESSIAFGQSVDSISAIVLYPPDGAPPRVLDLGVPAEAPAWRPPDGRQLAFLGLVDGRWMIHVADADGSNVRNLGLIPAGPVAWSPDGQFLAFDGIRGGADPADVTTRIHVAGVGPRGELLDDRTLVFDPRNDREVAPAWSPDGERLVFVSARDDSTVVAIGQADGTGYREVGVKTASIDASVSSAWFWAPDGRSLLQTYDDGTTWLLDPGGAPPRPAAFGSGAFSNWQRVAP